MEKVRICSATGTFFIEYDCMVMYCTDDEHLMLHIALSCPCVFNVELSFMLKINSPSKYSEDVLNFSGLAEVPGRVYPPSLHHKFWGVERNWLIPIQK